MSLADLIPDTATLTSKLAEAGYLADPGLSTALFCAVRLPQPLLLEGEAGVGKTQAAKSLAQLLDTPLIRLQCFEGIDASEALYEWNYPRQLLGIRVAEARGGDLAEESLFGPEYLIRRPLLAALERGRTGQLGDIVVVSPDVGNAKMANKYATPLGANLAIIDKRRPKANVSEVMNIIGEVDGRTCVIMDDMVDTAGTLCKAAQALKEHGAKRVLAYCTHPVLSGSAVSRIVESELDELVVTDTIPLSEEARGCPRIRQISIAELMAETMLRISNESSVSSLFMD